MVLENKRDKLEDRIKTEELAKREDSIVVLNEMVLKSKVQRDSIDSVNNYLEYQSIVVLNTLQKKDGELKAVKGSLKELTDNELVVEANKEYGGSDTTELTILLSRPTTEFLVESAKKVEILGKSLELSLYLNRNYRTQLDNDSILFNNYESELIFKDNIIQLRTEQLAISETSYSRLKKRADRRDKIKNTIIILLGGYIIGNSIFSSR